jgi:hypothetical protein
MGEKAVSDPAEIMSLARDLPRFAAERFGVENHVAPEIDSDPGSKSEYDLLRSRFDWIVDAFAKAVALAPDPTQFDPLIEVMRTGEGFLTDGVDLGLAKVDINGNVLADAASTKNPKDPFYGQISAMQTTVGVWSGDAAKAFKSDFLPTLATAPANQSLVFRGLNLAALAAKTVYEQYLLDLGDLVTKARAKLHPSFGLCHSPNLDVVLGLAVGISKVAVGLATLEEGAGVFEIAAGTLEIINVAHEAGKEEGGEKIQIDGVDAESIIDGTNEILNRIVTLLGQHEQDIINIIKNNDDELEVKHPTLFLVQPPTAVALANKASKDGKSVNDLWNQFD